jgi:CheY-like chemotaxis protein
MSSLIRNEEPIVIVDDDFDDHFIYNEIAERLGLKNKLKFFRNGTDALQYLRTTSDCPFIIFCDMNMPVMSGLQFRKIINAEEYLRKKSIPFIFLTTSASAAQVNEAYDLTVQGFFLKGSGFTQMEKTFSMIVEYWDRCLHPNTI